VGRVGWMLVETRKDGVVVRMRVRNWRCMIYLVLLGFSGKSNFVQLCLEVGAFSVPD